MSKLLRTGLVLALAAGPAMAVTYEPLVSWSEANGTGLSTSFYAAFTDGNSAYCALSGGGSPRFTRVDGLNQAVRTTTELVSAAQWTGLTGKTSVTPFYSFSNSGDYAQFTDSVSDAIWRINKSTGAITEYVSNGAITAYVGTSGASTLTAGDTAPDGEFAFYESSSKQILKTTGAGSVTTLVSNLQLSILGTVACTSIGYAPTGAMYWTNSTTDAIYLRDTNGIASEVLNAATISAVTGNTSISFKDILVAPDGYVYFGEGGSSSSILRFLPSNPAASLETYISNAELLAGPAQLSNVYTLDWYQNRLAFTIFATTGARGHYLAVPEPMSLSLLLLGLPLLRRRSR